MRVSEGDTQAGTEGRISVERVHGDGTITVYDARDRISYRMDASRFTPDYDPYAMFKGPEDY